MQSAAAWSPCQGRCTRRSGWDLRSTTSWRNISGSPERHRYDIWIPPPAFPASPSTQRTECMKMPDDLAAVASPQPAADDVVIMAVGDIGPDRDHPSELFEPTKDLIG